jgi:hypothetical protein
MFGASSTMFPGAGSLGALWCGAAFLWSYQVAERAARYDDEEKLIVVTNSDGKNLSCMGCIAAILE